MPTTNIGSGGLGVLEDPTGRRAVWLRRSGRLVFVLFLGWLLAILLGGLGLVPVGHIPLTHVLGSPHGPSKLAQLPQPRQPPATDLLPAMSAKAFAATLRRTHTPARGVHLLKHHRVAVPARRHAHGHRATAPGQTKTTPSNLHRRNTTAPGQMKDMPSATSSHGRSATAPGRTTTMSTTTAIPTARGRITVLPPTKP
jgi:hypothetical protein